MIPGNALNFPSMKNIKYLLFYSFLCTGLLACAQSKYGVKNLYATYTVHMPGNVSIDKDGNTIATRDTLNVIYVETSSEEIHWKAAWKNGKNYSIITALITTSTLEAGIKKMTNKKMILQASKGNKLWELRLIPEEKKIESPFKILPGEIILQGMYLGKKFTQKIVQQTELNSIPSV
jgi:hypothetical protein